MAVFPFIIIKEADLKQDKVLVNHEKIHLRQQLEMLVLFFFIWYTIEFLVRYIIYKNRMQAYRNISFEKEAYSHEKDLNYLKKRPFWKFLKFI